MYQKIKIFFTKHRSIVVPVEARNRFVDWVVPKHNETTLYILAVSFLATSLLNPVFGGLLTSPLRMALFGGIIISIVAAFMPDKIPGFRSFFAPTFILVCSILLAIEYVIIQLETESFLGTVLAAYHGLMVLALYSIWEGRVGILKNISDNLVTDILEILTATILVSVVFTVMYYITSWHEISWALPITTSLFLWKLFEKIQGSLRY